MSLYNWINEKFDFFTWSGTKKAPYGELIRPTNVDMDYARPDEKSVSTQIDCYVTGTYVTTKGKLFNIKERYKVTITYSSSTVLESMQRIREFLIKKFTEENPTFNVGEVFVPELTPLDPVPSPQFTYKGGRLFRYMTKFQEGKVVLKTEKDKYKSRAGRVIQKYGLKKREGLIKRL